MARPQTTANSIYFAIIALAVSSAWSAASIWGTRPVEELAAGDRRPASVQDVSIHGDEKSNGPADEMEVLRLGCWDHPPEKMDSPRAHWVRLSGEGCGRADPVEVRNRTNGFSATVFDLGTEDHTTDFIPLATGTNDVEIRVGEGPRQRTFGLIVSH